MRVTENPYLRFAEALSTSGKTITVSVYSARTGDLLATLAWWGPWRQYTFRPAPHTVWNTGCLATIDAYLAALMEARQSASTTPEEADRG